jgi:hypothetical protein
MKASHAGIYLALATLSLAGATLEAQGRGNGRGKQKDAAHDEGGGARTEIHVVFSTQDVAIIHEHYAPQRRNLPPGLQKKYARTGQLPPGWQKKMAPMPVVIERRLPPLPVGYHRGVFEGHAVIYKPGGLIIDATVIF